MFPSPQAARGNTGGFSFVQTMADLRILPPQGGSSVPEPVTLAEARAHLRLDGEVGDNPLEDAAVSSLITAARQSVESFTGRIFTAASYELRVDAFAVRIEFPIAPVRMVSAMSYVDPAGAVQAFDEDEFWLYDHPDDPALLAMPNTQFPSVLAMPGVVRITFTAGPSDDVPVPRAVVQAILLIIGHLYENRQDVVTSAHAVALDLPQGSRALLWPYRRGLGV